MGYNINAYLNESSWLQIACTQVSRRLYLIIWKQTSSSEIDSTVVVICFDSDWALLEIPLEMYSTHA